jgi:hypothetical protein
MDSSKYDLLKGCVDNDEESLRRPHRELQEAAEHYLHHRQVLVIFPEKVQGSPVVGMPSRMEDAFRALAKRRLCRREVSVREYVDKFDLGAALGQVVEFLTQCVKQSFLTKSPAVTTLRVGETTVEVGHVVSHMIQHQDEAMHPILQDALCVLSSAVVKRMQDVSLLTGTAMPDLRQADLDTTSMEAVRTMLLQTSGPGHAQLRQHALIAELLRRKAVTDVELQWPTVKFLWRIPPQLHLKCGAWIPRKETDKISWIGWGASPIPAHFHYPNKALVDRLEVELRWDDPAKARLTRLAPESMRTESEVELLVVAFVWCCLVGVGMYGGMRSLAAILGAMWVGDHVRQWWAGAVSTLGDIMAYWDAFETGEASQSEEDEVSVDSEAPEEDYVRLEQNKKKN